MKDRPIKIEDLINLLSDENKSKEEAEDEQINLPDESPNDLTIAYQRIKIGKLQEEVESLRQDRKQRKIFGYIIFGFMCVYMTASLTLVFFSGFKLVELSDTVIVTLLTTALANVIGIFNFVAKYLFHTKN